MFVLRPCVNSSAVRAFNIQPLHRIELTGAGAAQGVVFCGNGYEVFFKPVCTVKAAVLVHGLYKCDNITHRTFGQVLSAVMEQSCKKFADILTRETVLFEIGGLRLNLSLVLTFKLFSQNPALLYVKHHLSL